MRRREFLTVGAAAIAGAGMVFENSAVAAGTQPSLAVVEPSWKRLPQWRGFNLLEKFMQPSGNKRFVEDDFRMMHDWGFDFVRLPMDYRNWIVDGDWERIDEAVLKEIDEAVEFGDRYGIHVCMNFHRAPGYTVASPPEPKPLWTDHDAQRVCAMHWRTFARRYRDQPNHRVSFNLFNEPSDVPLPEYVATVQRICDVIREESPERLIICDGLGWGTKPCMELLPLEVAQATRGYTPMEISHYQANWVNSADFPTPQWPMPSGTPGTLYGSSKPELAEPMRIAGPFPTATRLRMKIGTVSTLAQLIVTADGATIFEKQFICGPEKGYGDGGSAEWEKAVHMEEWNCWQNIYNVDCEVEIPAGTRAVEIRVGDGDWLHLREIGLTPGATGGTVGEAVRPFRSTWGEKPTPLAYDAAANRVAGGMVMDREWLRTNCIEPWKVAEAAGIGVMVGEFGAYSRTPHDVTLAWLEDNLANWKDAGWGWAMWNLRGGIGILNSDRADVKYENFHGRQLDRAMLELLQRY